MKSRKYLKDYIHRIRRSQDRQSILRAVLRFACVGAVLLMICILISRLRHFYYADLIGVICISTAAAAGLIWGLIHRGRPEDTAVYLDSFGMKEKLITAYEEIMRGSADESDPGDIRNMQIEDAAATLRYREKALTA